VTPPELGAVHETSAVVFPYVEGRLTLGADGADGAVPSKSGLDEPDDDDSVALVDSMATAVNV
jgi:hypothetical protein